MTAIKSAIRACIKANRLMEEYKEMMRGSADEGLDPSIIIIFDNGYYTIISGSGKIYHAFCHNKTLGNYTGSVFSTFQSFRSKLQHIPFANCSL